MRHVVARLVGAVGPFSAHVVVWSRSQAVAGMQHPGNTQVRSLDATVRRCFLVGRHRVVPYGASADWVKNVLAQGSAVIVNEGNTYQLERPELVSSEKAMAEIPPKYQRSLRLFDVEEFLWVRFVGPH